MTNYGVQVDASHYTHGSYREQDRWNSYWHQLELVRSVTPMRVLEVGPGERVVTDQLRKEGVSVTTCDIAEDVKPDIVASVTHLPVDDNTFDVVLAAEILEHIHYDDVLVALRECARVARSHVVISIPHPGWVFSLIGKVPLIKRFELLFQIPFWWKAHHFNGQHYWELGKKGYPTGRFIETAKEAGLDLVSFKKYANDPAHRFFLFRKTQV